MKRLSQWPSTVPLVGDVRGRGLMIGIEIVGDKKQRTPAAELRDTIVDTAFYKGLLILGAGPNTLRLCPPLIVSKEQADVAMDILEECIRGAEGARSVADPKANGKPQGA